MRQLLFLTLAVLFLAGPAAARGLPQDARSRQTLILAHAGPKTRAFVLREAAAELRLRKVSEATARGAARKMAPALGAKTPIDVDAIAFLILAQVVEDADDQLNSLNTLGEADQLKLQELTDQRSKALETLSNLMKSLGDVRKSITDNMK